MDLCAARSQMGKVAAQLGSSAHSYSSKHTGKNRVQCDAFLPYALRGQVKHTRQPANQPLHPSETRILQHLWPHQQQSTHLHTSLAAREEGTVSLAGQYSSMQQSSRAAVLVVLLAACLVSVSRGSFEVELAGVKVS